MVPDPIAAIERYTEAVKRQKIRPTCNRCPRCEGEPECFHRHDERERQFLVIVERVVHLVLSLITRWKCPLCGQRFTLYPPFALPRKRYVKDSILELASPYLEDDELSYRRSVEVGGRPLFRDRQADGSIDDRALAPSTLHRWLPFFSSVAETLREAVRLVRESSAPSDLFRRVFAIAPRKHRSEARREVLIAALRGLWTDREFHRVFGRSVFPELATASGWT